MASGIFFFVDHKPLTAIPFVIAHVGRLRVDIRPEIAQHDQGLTAGVVYNYAFPGGFMADEYLVIRQFPESDHRRRLQKLLADPTSPLHRNQAVSTVVSDRYLHEGIDG